MSDATSLTSRCCRKCGAIFPVGHDTSERVALDTHCGFPTIPCPTFDGEWAERQQAYRDHFAGGRVPVPDPPIETGGRWWD